jgi:DNA-binding transcriptional regulator YiaG
MKITKTQGPFRWKDFASVLLVSPIELLKCQDCGEHGLRPGDAKNLDHAIEASIRSYSKEMVETILAREECSQVDLAARAGITPEYLSGLKTGARTPGFQTFNILKMLASDPRAFEISDPKSGLLEDLTSSAKDNYDEMLQKLA